MKAILFLVCSFFSGAALAQSKLLLVAQDGSGAYRSVQAALNAVPKGNTTPLTIFVRKGTYKEKLNLAKKQDFVHLVGEDANATILTYDDYKGKQTAAGYTLGTSEAATFRVFAANFSAENLTFQNPATGGQAPAMWVYGDRVQFKNCRFLGTRDVLYPYGYGSRQLYQNCYIEGTTDAILGSATALFEDCTVVCKPGGTCLAAPSTPDSVRYGFVFQRCKINGEAQPGSYYLARPWKPFAKMVLLNCELGPVVRDRGWDHWSKESNKQDAFFAEYKSTGVGAVPKARAPWSRQLSPEQAAFYTREKVLRGWVPTTF
jgi:pectinesterase